MVRQSDRAKLCCFLQQRLPINNVDDKLCAKHSVCSFTKEGEHNVAADSVGDDDGIMGITLYSTLVSLKQPASEDSKDASFGSFQASSHGPYRASGSRGPVDEQMPVFELLGHTGSVVAYLRKHGNDGEGNAVAIKLTVE